MVHDDITLLSVSWEGFELVGVVRDTAVVPPLITLTLQAVPGAARQCSECAAAGMAAHDVSERRERELPIIEETNLVRHPACARQKLAL